MNSFKGNSQRCFKQLQMAAKIYREAFLSKKPDLENLEIRPGGLENLENLVFFNGKP